LAWQALSAGEDGTWLNLEAHLPDDGLGGHIKQARAVLHEGLAGPENPDGVADTARRLAQVVLAWHQRALNPRPSDRG
jgi:hypothetical protein